MPETPGGVGRPSGCRLGAETELIEREPSTARHPRRAAALAGALVLAAAIGAASAAQAGSLQATPAIDGGAPLQPIVDRPAPAESHRFDFGAVRVTPSTLVAGAPTQSLRVAIDPSAVPAAARLELRVYRPAEPDSPRGYNVTRLGLTSRTVAFDGEQPSAVLLPNLTPAPGEYRVEVLDPSGPGPARLLGAAPL